MCELFFFDHVAGGVPPESIDIHQEVYLGPDAFAEIRVKAGEAAPYYVEIKPGYSGERVLESIARKYGAGGPASAGAARLIVLADASVLANAALERALRASLRPGLELELWDEQRLFDAIDKRFGLRLDALREQDLLGLRSALDRAKGVYAFGDEFQNDSLEASLLWHLAPRQLRRLRGSGRTSPPVQGLALVGRDVISEERVEALARRRRRLARRLEPALSADVGLQENRAESPTACRESLYLARTSAWAYERNYFMFRAGSRRPLSSDDVCGPPDSSGERRLVMPFVRRVASLNPLGVAGCLASGNSGNTCQPRAAYRRAASTNGLRSSAIMTATPASAAASAPGVAALSA